LFCGGSQFFVGVAEKRLKPGSKRGFRSGRR
jgi:hypothetical protein